MRRHVLVIEDGTVCGSDLHRMLWQLDYPVLRIRADQVSAWQQQLTRSVVFAGPGVSRALRLRRATNLAALVQVEAEEESPRLLVAPDALLCAPFTPTAIRQAADQAERRRLEREREGAQADLLLLVPSDPELLEELITLLPSWFAACGLTTHQVRQLTLAVREVGANSIEWGHRYERERQVVVHGRLDHEKVSVLIHDEGPGFDRYNLPHAARPGDPFSHLSVRAACNLREGGFGILLAGGMADHLCYNDTGNEALLIKYLPRLSIQPPPVELLNLAIGP